MISHSSHDPVSVHKAIVAIRNDFSIIPCNRENLVYVLGVYAEALDLLKVEFYDLFHVLDFGFLLQCLVRDKELATPILKVCHEFFIRFQSILRRDLILFRICVVTMGKIMARAPKRNEVYPAILTILKSLFDPRDSQQAAILMDQIQPFTVQMDTEVSELYSDAAQIYNWMQLGLRCFQSPGELIADNEELCAKLLAATSAIAKERTYVTSWDLRLLARCLVGHDISMIEMRARIKAQLHLLVKFADDNYSESLLDFFSQLLSETRSTYLYDGPKPALPDLCDLELLGVLTEFGVDKAKQLLRELAHSTNVHKQVNLHAQQLYNRLLNA